MYICTCIPKHTPTHTDIQIECDSVLTTVCNRVESGKFNRKQKPLESNRNGRMFDKPISY